MAVIDDIRRTIRYAGRNGLIETWYAARERLKERTTARYHYAPPDEHELAVQRSDWERLKAGEEPEEVFRCSCKFSYAPRISLLVPSYDANESFFREMIASVLAQTYGNFELVIADGGGSGTAQMVLAEFADPRIIYRRLSVNGGISANTNAAAQDASGDYVAFLDHDDMLTPDALYETALRIMRTGAEVLYSDEDKCDASGRRFFEPNLKPDYNHDYLLANNYICHLLTMRRGLFTALGLRSRFDGAQDYDLVLRSPKSSIAHIPKVLYHWRQHEDSTAANPDSKNYAYEAGRRALEDYLESCRIAGTVSHSRHLGFYEIEYEPDIFAARSEVGIVGGKVLDRHRRIIGGMMDRNGEVMFRGLHEMESGPMHRADTVQDAEAVDVRCMEIRPELRGLYREIFGADYEDHVMTGSQELKEKSIAFCRRAEEMGYLTVWDPSMTRTAGN